MSHNDALARWCKAQEIKALETERGLPSGEGDYWAGKAEGFANVWERIVFGGRAPTPQAYNLANEHWSSTVADTERES